MCSAGLGGAGWHADVRVRAGLQGLLCGVLQVIIQKLSEVEATKVSPGQWWHSARKCLHSVGHYGACQAKHTGSELHNVMQCLPTVTVQGPVSQ